MDQSDGPLDRFRLESRTLPPLQANFTNQAHQQSDHSAPAVTFFDEKSHSNVTKEDSFGPSNGLPSVDQDVKAKNVKRRISRFGLNGLFSRSKQSDLEARREKLGLHLELDENTESNARKGTDLSNPTRRTSVVEGTDAASSTEYIGGPLRHKTSKRALRAKSSFKKELNIRKLTTWDPPPLFQAYPQAVKYATLRAPSLSAEAILRQSVNRSSGTKADSESHTSDSNPAKPPKEKKAKRQAPAETPSKGDWTHKVFVLVTSGYLLQYAGDGASDRLPEKIMPLTTESAAFVSDVIPRQPYVLQVSQVSDDQGTLDKEASKSMLKKLGLRNEVRRSTSSLLLVLESPGEMSAWLTAVRKEIQAISGKAFMSNDMEKEQSEQAIPPLQQRPSQRYLVQRDPNRFTEKPQDESVDADHVDDSRVQRAATERYEAPIPPIPKRQSLVNQTSVGSRSVSNSVNQTHLDRLRQSPRESNVSTASTSRGSSPRLIPNNVALEAPDSSRGFAESRPITSTYPLDTRDTTLKSYETSGAHQGSLRARGPMTSQQELNPYMSQHRRTSSPTAPNFSVPTFSKRFSTANGSPALSSRSKAKNPPITLAEPPSPPVIEEHRDMNEESTSTVSELQHLRKLSPNFSKRASSAESQVCLTPPHSSGSCNPPPSSEHERPFSRRYSSLEYSRGVSPLQLARQSPSPHPAPTAALPAIPSTKTFHRASLVPPPTTALPPIPTTPPRYSVKPSEPSLPPESMNTTNRRTTTATSQEYSSHSSDIGSAKALAQPADYEQRSHISSAHTPIDQRQESPIEAAPPRPFLTHKPAQGLVRSDFLEARKLRRPLSIQARNDAMPDQPSFQSSQTCIAAASDAEGLIPQSDESSPKPTREPPPQPLPPRRSYVQNGITSPRIGREPPPVYSPATSPKSRISVSSRADSYFDGAAPHPFIPPIRVSERKFRGSLDGPWNTAYDAPQRTFVDLNIS